MVSVSTLYTVNEHLTNPRISKSQKYKEPDMATNNKNTVFVHIHHRSTKQNSFTAGFFLDGGPCQPQNRQNAIQR